MWIRNAIQNWRRRRRADAELDEEVRGYAAMLADEKMRSGVVPGEAMREAKMELGGVEQVKEQTREVRAGHFLETLWQDVRYGGRMLRKNPGFTLVAVITLALGIGANTAIFSVVDAVLLRPLPFLNPDRVVQLWETEGSPGNFPIIGQDFLDWRAQNKTFQDMAIFSYEEDFNASGTGEADRATVIETSANFFSLLGVKPFLGRSFVNGENQAGKNNVALLSYGFWERHFGGQKDAIGKTVVLNSAAYSVVGVMPPWYKLPAPADVWIPLDVSEKEFGPRGSHKYKAIGRMKSGVSLAQASADLRGIAARLEKTFPNSNNNVSTVVVSLKEQLTGGTQSELWIMFGAVGLVLLIACINVANLLLARSANRRNEAAIRSALGASRTRLVRQLLTESLLLSLCGAVPGIGLAYACVSTVAKAKTFPIPQPNPMGVNSTVLLFTVGISVVIGILFGMLPAFQTSQSALSGTIKANTQKAYATSARGRFLRDGLVAAEVALSLALVISAGLLLRTFAEMRKVNIGVKPEKVLTAMVQLPAKQYESAERRMHFLSHLLDSLRSTPGVLDAAVSDALPLMPGTSGYVDIDGSTDESLKKELVEDTYVTPDYFRVLGIPMLKGRGFEQADIDRTANELNGLEKFMEKNPSTKPTGHIEIDVVVNKAMADRFWKNQEALGKTIQNGDSISLRVVGIAGNTRQWSLRRRPVPELYWPLPITLQFGQEPLPLTISVLSAGAPESLTKIVTEAVHAQDNSVAVFNVRTIPQIISESMTDTSYQTYLLGALAALALILAAVGTYGVMSYAVAQRTHEIGIRMAIGASSGQVLWMILQQGLLIAGLGIAIGLAASLAVTRSLQDLLYGVKPEDPATLGVACLVMGIVALAACWIPARRAMKVDPMVALRYE